MNHPHTATALTTTPSATSSAPPPRAASARSWDHLILPVVFLILMLGFFSIDQKFLSQTNVQNVLTQVSILAVVTIGASVVIFSGGFDLSAGAVVALSGVAAALAVEHTGSVGLGVLTGLTVGTAVGVINGALVGYLNVSPLIVTLGALNVCRGLALVLATDGPIYSFPGWFTDLGASNLLGIPALAWVAIVVFALVGFLLRHTVFGLYVYATGGNATATGLSGISVAKVKMAAFAISGAACGIAGVMLCSRTGGGEPSSGMLYELEAIAAVVLGGAALSGGEGKLWRSVLAILLLAVLANGLNIVGVHPHWKGVVIGVILTAAAALDAYRKFR
ncbi:ribose transport system permease protein [Variovorax boronicumulans]|uniref:ABC transporter permease n=1 Tax=Variovorax boronicumulans TaxID=436515 RepID=UPI0027893A68|nr:ABC transporter permease [Variovorax boronicumulans]MDP9993921.1 ribose transport system permease protein [Variovorax boronicumulans]MDQ0005216.1 ribose transport system permease protein [Variovorax boronicumulans]